MTLENLGQQLSAAAAMKKYKPATAKSVIAVCMILIIPTICLIATFALEQDQDYSYSFSLAGSQRAELVMEEDPCTGEMVEVSKLVVVPQTLYRANLARYSHACGPKYGTLVEEVTFVQAPLVIAGLFCCLFAAKIGKLVAVMQQKDSRSSKVTGGSKTKAKKRSTNKALVALASNMLRFGVACILSVTLYVIAVALFMPSITEVSNNIGKPVCSRLKSGRARQ